MKSRLIVVALVVVAWLAGKWSRGDLDHLLAPSKVVTADAKTTSGDSEAKVSNPSKPTDPLVEPFKVPGVMPGWKPGGPSTLVNFTTAIDQFAHGTGAAFHAHGEEVCASGCAASNHPTKELTREHFLELLDRFAFEPMTENSSSLERLLYFGRQTRELIEREGFGPLDAERSRFLWNELSRGHAHISLRVVDEHGEVRSWLDPTEVPFDRRHVFDMKTRRVQPLNTSGTVKRVGLYHLWTRL